MKTILEEQPTSRNIVMMKPAISCWQGNPPTKRIMAITKLLDERPARIEFKYMLGAAYMNMGDFILAQECFADVFQCCAAYVSAAILSDTCRIAVLDGVIGEISGSFGLKNIASVVACTWKSETVQAYSASLKYDPAQCLLVFAFAGTSHLGMRVDCAGEVTCRVLGVYDYFNGIRRGVFAKGYCIACGHDRTAAPLANCPKCGCPACEGYE